MVQFCFLRSYLGIETVSFHLLLRMARMDMDWNLKKLSQLRLCSHKSGFFFKTAYIFTRIVPPSTRNQWIWTPNPHCFETTLPTGLKPRPHDSKNMRLQRCWIQGRGPGGPGPPLFLDQTEARRAEKFFWRPPPSLSQGLDDRASPPSFIWLRVWIRQCLDLSRFVCTWPYCDSKTHRGLGPHDSKW